MNACVVDASVAIKWYLPEVHADKALMLLARRSADRLQIHVPDICLAEVGNALWKKVRRREIARQEAWDAAILLLGVPSVVYASGPLLTVALDLALTAGASVYDSLYVSLAAALGVPLVTADAKLRNALARTRWRSLVRWIEDV